METINDRITASRQAQKMSKAELARRIGISHASVSKWESGLNQPKGRYLNDLAAALGVTVDWLLTGDGEATACARSDVWISQRRTGRDPARYARACAELCSGRPLVRDV